MNERNTVGSTWFGDAQTLLKSSRLAANLTMHFFDKEFNYTENPEILHYFNSNKIEGSWPEWWRPVSSMYGQELAFNHLIDGITETNSIMGDLIDVESCRTSSIQNHIHIHCWHSDCEFSKFRFLDPLVALLSDTTQKSKAYPVRPQYATFRNASEMSVAEYCTYIAWNSLTKYIDWFGKIK